MSKKMYVHAYDQCVYNIILNKSDIHNNMKRNHYYNKNTHHSTNKITKVYI